VIVSVHVIGASNVFVHNVIAGLGEHDAAWFSQNPAAARPSTSVRYMPDGKSDRIDLVDAATLLELGIGSCGSLSAAEYGWLRAHDHQASLVVRKMSPGVWHVVVRLPNGTVWDPAKGAA